jgi:eukaryotic-like serine/threonine-protein kinase
MPLAAGTKLGSYQVTAQIGAGGMGEVYQAHDTKLGRDVAIKVLPAAFAHDPERLARFQREAKMLASLNHPNIAAIYGLEENRGSSYLVMELVPGDTLADRIKRDGAIPVVEALTIAKQMAEAFEAAHEKGIIHRDLKPANVKVTPEGKVKVLDFGLAKAFEGDSSSQDIANSPTMSGAATMQGVILGTAAYMSPEQARGKSVDRRADIWAFGVVLYEMLTGQQLFAGETVSDTLAAVLRHEPDYSRVPARTQRLLRWCLEKDPKKRLRDITDGVVLLEEEPDHEIAKSGAGAFSIWPWAFGAACLVALGLAFVLFREKPPMAPEAYRFTVRLPENATFSPSAQLALSPDGRRVAFPAIGKDGRTSVWVQEIDGEEARVIPESDPQSDPPPFFWSPDSRFIAFPSNSKIRKADVSDGTVQDICDRTALMVGGSWNRDGVIIFGTNTTGLWRVSAEGGAPVPLTILDASRHEVEHELPSFLPDGRHFLYFINSQVPEDSGMYVGSLDDSPERQSKKRLLATRFGATYVSSDRGTGDGGTGRLLFLRNNVVMAQAFDTTKFELLGEPAQVADRVGSAYETPHFSVSPNVLVYRGQGAAPALQLAWFDAQGKVIGKVGEKGMIKFPRLSPDGSRVAYQEAGSKNSESDIWLLDLKRDSTTRFTFGPGKAVYPRWSPDGSEIVFSSNRDGRYNLYRKPADGARAEQILLRTNEDKRVLSWSRDGRFLLYGVSQNLGNEQMWVLPMRGDPKPIPFSNPRFNESEGEFSPDGRWVAYESNESGRPEVYVRELNGSGGPAETGGKWMISKNGGAGPFWRADGKEIAYAGLDRTAILSVDVDTQRTFQAGPPRQLMNVLADCACQGIAATPDFKRFLMPVTVESNVPQSFTVMLNWSAGLKK